MARPTLPQLERHLFGAADILLGQANLMKGTRPMDDNARLLAIAVLLSDPEEINDILETELYLLRDKLQLQPRS